jgi:hypothetical protein
MNSRRKKPAWSRGCLSSPAKAGDPVLQSDCASLHPGYELPCPKGANSRSATVRSAAHVQAFEKSFESSEHAPMEPAATIPIGMKCWREGSPSATAQKAKAIAAPLAAINGALAATGTTRVKLASTKRDGQETKKPKTNAKNAPSAGSRSAAEAPPSIIAQRKEPSTPKIGPKTR